jgi:ADP-glucose pyrophosphorylase
MKNTLDCFDDDWKFYTLSAQTTPEKVSEKQRN